jgi:hypothetical protein
LRTALPGADSPFKPLPGGVSFRVALRRSVRVGDRSGVVLEDLGVVPDELHDMTRNDVLNNNEDLINHAGKILSGMTPFVLRGVAAPVASPGTGFAVTIQTKNLDRVDVLLDGRTRVTSDVVDGTTTVNLPTATDQTDVELRGFQGTKLRAAARISLGATS